MDVYIVAKYDKTSFEADERVVIEMVFENREDADEYSDKLVLKSFEASIVKEYAVI